MSRRQPLELTQRASPPTSAWENIIVEYGNGAAPRNSLKPERGANLLGQGNGAHLRLMATGGDKGGRGNPANRGR